jgi:outer membrane protein assembly factor BamB
MKIQCACGAKYAFDATPEMLQNPVRFVCPSCGLDSSDFVNELVRREFAGQTPAASPPVTESPRLKIFHGELPPSAPVEEAATAPAAEEHCLKHPRELAVQHCVVCGKPMCGQCMSLFGHVCSPLCRAKAEAQNINIPVYAGQSAVADARYWRKVGLIAGSIAAILVAALGFWTWYAWIGSQPHVAFSIRFDDRAYAGESRLCGTNQIVFLHGGTLARCDIKSKKEIWSQELVSKQQIADLAARQYQSQPNNRDEPKIPQSKIEEMVAQSLESELQLCVSGQNVWVRTPGRLTHYDWDTGKVLQEIPFAGGTEFIARNDEFLIVGAGANGQALVTHINPATGESRVEQIGQPGQTLVAAKAPVGNSGGQTTAGLPLAPGTGAGGPMNPAKVGEQAQNLTLPGRIALPALLANSSEQERITAELKDQDQAASGAQPSARQTKPVQNEAGYFTLIPGEYGYVQFAVRLMESHVITREAMKAPPKTSALNGNVSTANETAAINETLNEMQHTKGGDTVQEDESLYQVTLRRSDSTSAADWIGQVTGPPALFPLKTVNVLAAGKTVIVLDKTNKKLWQAALTYNVAGGNRAANGETPPFGDGPCVEHGDTLYVIDQAVLTAFDIATGNPRWRLPSVGVVGLFFDDKGMLFVNTTTADPDNIRYSRQIDITQKIEAILLKIDPQTGRTLWSVKPGGFISYLSGKFIYTVQSFDPGDQEASPTGIQLPAYLKIRRINPADGRVLWDYEEDRAPLDVRFKDNSIELVFRKEVQVLKYLSF